MSVCVCVCGALQRDLCEWLSVCVCVCVHERFIEDSALV